MTASNDEPAAHRAAGSSPTGSAVPDYLQNFLTWLSTTGVNWARYPR